MLEGTLAGGAFAFGLLSGRGSGGGLVGGGIEALAAPGENADGMYGVTGKCSLEM